MRVSIQPIGLARLEPSNIDIDIFFLHRLIKLPLLRYISNLWNPNDHFTDTHTKVEKNLKEEKSFSQNTTAYSFWKYFIIKEDSKKVRVPLTQLETLCSF